MDERGISAVHKPGKIFSPTGQKKSHIYKKMGKGKNCNCLLCHKYTTFQKWMDEEFS